MNKLKYIICTAGALLMLTICASADDFVYKYSDDCLLPLSADEDGGGEVIGLGYYTTDDEAWIIKMLDAGIIEYYEPVGEVFALDAANDRLYNLNQKNYEFTLTNAIGAVNNGAYNGAGVKIGILDSGLVDGHEDIDYSRIAAKRNIYYGTDDVTDEYHHGTNVTGIVAAKTNNSVGVASLAPEADLVIVKIFHTETDRDGQKVQKCSTTELFQGINYAVEQGCDVINLSVGTEQDYKLIKAAVDNAVENGVLVVAAAGNHSSSNPDKWDAADGYIYPAAYDNVVSVASVNKSGVRAEHSYHNDKVTVAACGESVSLLSLNGGYATGTGTSYAAPYVSAVAALVKQIRPDIQQAEFMELLSSTALKAPDTYNSQTLSSEMYLHYYGAGIVNVGKVLDTLLGPNITASEIEFGLDDWVSRSTVTNNGFDSYTLTDIWTMNSGGEQVSRKISQITIAPRSSEKREYSGWYTVSHMLWLSTDSLIPICEKSEYETGIGDV